MLDFSDKKNGGPPGTRNLDHQEMRNFEHKGKQYTPGVAGFMQMGNIRLMPESGGIDLMGMPSGEQAQTLRK